MPYDLFFQQVPASHRAFLEHLVPYFRTPSGVCVHGGLDPHVARLEEQPLEALLWGTSSFPSSYAGADPIVYGHRDSATVDSQGWPSPTIVGATIGSDTISHGVLTAVRLEDGCVFQSATH